MWKSFTDGPNLVPAGQGGRRLHRHLPRRVRALQRRILELVPQRDAVAAGVSRDVRRGGINVLGNCTSRQGSVECCTLPMHFIFLGAI